MTVCARVCYLPSTAYTAYTADSGKNLIEQYTYDAYGNPTFLDTAGNPITTSVCATDFLCTGQQWNSLSNLYDNRNRFYSPELGRFLQPDPIGFSGDPSNLYRYCGNNPVNRSDPMGTDTYFGYRRINSADPVPIWSDWTHFSHQFVYTTNSAGQLAHVYTWGTNSIWAGRWQEDPNSPALTAAANSVIARNLGDWQGDSTFDAYVQSSFDQFSQHAPHFNWGVASNCQTEAQSLIDNARAIQAQQMSSSFAGYNPAVFNVGMVPDVSYNINGGLYEGLNNGLPVFKPQPVDGTGNGGPMLGDVGYGSAGMGYGTVLIGLGGGGTSLETQVLQRQLNHSQ